MSKYDENGQLKCLTEPCKECEKLRQKNNKLNKKYNYEKRLARALRYAYCGDPLPHNLEAEFGAMLDKLG